MKISLAIYCLAAISYGQTECSTQLKPLKPALLLCSTAAAPACVIDRPGHGNWVWACAVPTQEQPNPGYDIPLRVDHPQFETPLDAQRKALELRLLEGSQVKPTSTPSVAATTPATAAVQPMAQPRGLSWIDRNRDQNCGKSVFEIVFCSSISIRQAEPLQLTKDLKLYSLLLLITLEVPYIEHETVADRSARSSSITSLDIRAVVEHPDGTIEEYIRNGLTIETTDGIRHVTVDIGMPIIPRNVLGIDASEKTAEGNLLVRHLFR